VSLLSILANSLLLISLTFILSSPTSGYFKVILASPSIKSPLIFFNLAVLHPFFVELYSNLTLALFSPSI